MFHKPKALVLRTAGTNCDRETAFAFELAGAKVETVHINRLVSGEKFLRDFTILAIPGGFTYGDDIASGKILANEIRNKLKFQLARFVEDGKLIIGICNGFQVLVKMGLLPNISANIDIEVTLSLNDSAKFEARWAYLKPAACRLPPAAKCVWTEGIDDIIYLPVAHGEGKFLPRDEDILCKLKENGQIILQYCDDKGEFRGYPENPNGSVENIAGICDRTGRIFGLMPHPERHIQFTQHPRWTRLKDKKEPDGLKIFKSAVRYAKKFL